MEVIDNLLLTLKVPTVMVKGFTINMVAAIAVGIGMRLALLAIRARGFLPKVCALAALPLMGTSVAVAMVEQLSRPKELSIAWFQAQGTDGVSIHSTIVMPPEKIHVWMDVDGEPRNFYVAWSEQIERSLTEAQKALEGSGGGQLKLRFEPSLETKLQFYPMPWPAPAPKDQPLQDDPMVVEQEA